MPAGRATIRSAVLTILLAASVAGQAARSAEARDGAEAILLSLPSAGI